MSSYSHRKILFGARWKMVLYHDSSQGNFFDKDNVLSTNSNQGRTYSDLKSITNANKYYGYFEFLLEYPTISPCYIYWKQKVNPIDTNPGDDNIEFEPKFVPDQYSNFQELAKSVDSTSTFLDGSPGVLTNSWFFAVGCYSPFGTATTFPGPVLSTETNVGIPKALLWIMIGLEFTSANIFLNIAHLFLPIEFIFFFTKEI